MKQSELAMALGTMQEEMDNIIHSTAVSLNNTFSSLTTDNEKADLEANMHNSMVNYLIYSSVNSKYKKYFDLGKTAMDTGVESLGTDPSGVAGTTLSLHENNVFTFTKRQNKNSEQTTVVDLCNALARAGVEKAVVDAAMKQATKPKKGNVYYDVKTVEE
jgi:hypothetical protein